MPDKNKPDFFAEAGQIGRIMREYQLQEVNIGQVRFLTPVPCPQSILTEVLEVQLHPKPLL